MDRLAGDGAGGMTAGEPSGAAAIEEDVCGVAATDDVGGKLDVVVTAAAAVAVAVTGVVVAAALVGAEEDGDGLLLFC